MTPEQIERLKEIHIRLYIKWKEEHYIFPFHKNPIDTAYNTIALTIYILTGADVSFKKKYGFKKMYLNGELISEIKDMPEISPQMP